MIRRRFYFDFVAIAALVAVTLPRVVRAAEPPDETNPPPAANSPANKPSTDEKKDPAVEKSQENGDSAAASPTPMRIDPAAQLLERLKPESLQSVAEMIAQDWPDRPEWAEMALAVMRGQAMQPGAGWWRATDKKYGWTWLKRKYDKNSDNIVQRDEFEDSAPRNDLFFKRFDRDLDGKITAADFDVSVFQGASPAASKSRMAEFFFHRLDADTNGQVTKEEIASFFDRADSEKTSFVTAEDLLGALEEEESQQRSSESASLSTSKQLSMFFAGQLGWFEEGPKLGDRAPDFTLATHDQGGTITLSGLRDKKPVVLIFGSFT